MTYEEALEKIHSLLTFGSRPGLDRMLTLLERLGNPQDKLRFIHVAGTNGKGSVCAVLSSVLVAAGYKTGLFISPYITDFRERIQINNQMISREALAKAVEETYPVLMKLRGEGVVITEFEYVNALEFYIHAAESCDVVVLETGMGGLLDCTNVIKPPLCSVITTIGLDHTAVLGSTLEEIAAQKAGIIKPGSAAVTSAQDSRAFGVIARAAKNAAVPLIESGSVEVRVLSQDLGGSVFTANGIELRLKLAGSHQIENAKTAIAALEYLRLNNILELTDADIKNGVFAAQNPARLELLCAEPVVLLDGAHNPNGAQALKAAAEQFLRGKKIYCVMGMLADKDCDSAISLLAPLFEAVFTVSVSNPRTLGAEKLAAKFKPYCKNVTPCASAEKAFDLALENARQNGGAVLVCGSLYLAGELRTYMISKTSFFTSRFSGRVLND